MPYRSRILFGVIAAVYLLSFPYHPALRSPNELSRLWQSRALVDHGTLELNRTLREYGWVGDLSVRNGRYYPSKAPLLSFLAAPIYAGLKGWAHAPVPELPQVYLSRLLLTVLPTLLMLVLLRRFLQTYLTSAVTDALVATYALGSLALNYSLMFFSHQLTAVLAFCAFYVLWRIQRGDWQPKTHWVAGACAGATVACEYTGALTVLALVFYALLGARRRWTRLAQGFGLALLGALPFIAGLMLYHQACFGHPLESGYKHLNDPGYQPWHLGGFLGIHLPDARAFFLSFFSPLRGLFVMSPFLVLGLAGLVLLWRMERNLFWFTSLLFLANTYFTSAFSYDSWGWSPGPRHLTPLVPFLLLPCGLALEWLSLRPGAAKLGYGVASGLCVASIFITGTVALVDYVPPELSTSLFGLALPLFAGGYFAPTVLLFLGIPNPVSGAAAWFLVLLAAVLVAYTLNAAAVPNREGRWRVWLGSVLAVIVIPGLLLALTRYDAADAGALHFMEKSWLAPPGQQVTFWR